VKNNSKKIIRSFLTIITFSFILNFSFISDSYSNICATAPAGTDNSGNKFVDTLTWEKQAPSASPAYISLHGFNFPTEWPGTPPHTRYRCGTIDEAASGNDYAISIINSLNTNERIWQSASSIDLTNFGNATPCCFTNESIPGKKQFYNLLTTDNETIADSQINARRILVVQIEENPIVFSEHTIGMKIRFKTNNAIDVRVFQRTEEDLVLAGTKMVAEAIWLDIQTKERRGRRGRTGDWR